MGAAREISSACDHILEGLAGDEDRGRDVRMYGGKDCGGFCHSCENSTLEGFGGGVFQVTGE